MADKQTIVIGRVPAGNPVASSTSTAGSPRGGLLERTITRLLMRPARVSGVTSLSDTFRLIELQGEALKDCTWLPGDKIQVKLDGGLITRTYTPIDWDLKSGTTLIVAFGHAAGPGSEWSRSVIEGADRQLFGPRRSLNLDDIASPTILFGDETSFGLALALDTHGEPGATRHFIFEVNDRRESTSVMSRLGLTAATYVERRPGDAHLHEICDAMVRFAQPECTIVLSGKASSIQHVNRTLKAKGFGARQFRTKPYWAPGKVGLD
jgi:NADPH-dependent ferric siderophore reductase